MQYMTKNLLLSALASALTLASVAQISIADFPKTKQLYPRNLKTNEATIVADGYASESENYKKVQLKVYRNGEFVRSIEESLSYKKGTAHFKIKTTQKAELAEYRYELYVNRYGKYELVQQADSVVAGDAFILSGQSNSVANSYRGSADQYKNEYVRTFGSTIPDSTVANDLSWYIAEGDSYSSSAQIGQWGLKLGNGLVTSQNIPIAIIAGGVGGTHILQHMRTDTNPQNLKNISGRLLYRVANAGLQKNIRAIFWHQGESDAYYRRTVADYKTLWATLRAHWAKDYKSVEHFFTFQIRQGCGNWQNFDTYVMEAQRQIAKDSANVHVISTNGTDQMYDYCHFPFIKGYDIFADRLLPQVLHYMYKVPASTDMTSPDVVSAKLVSATLIEVNFSNPETGISADPGVENDFQIADNYEVSVVKAYVQDNKLMLELSKPVAGSIGLSYVGHPGQGAPYIKRPNGNGALSFYNFPVN